MRSRIEAIGLSIGSDENGPSALAVIQGGTCVANRSVYASKGPSKPGSVYVENQGRSDFGLAGSRHHVFLLIESSGWYGDAKIGCRSIRWRMGSQRKPSSDRLVSAQNASFQKYNEKG